MGTIYTPIHQVPTSALKDTADWLIERRKLTLPLRPWKIVSQGWRLRKSGRNPALQQDRQVTLLANFTLII